MLAVISAAARLRAKASHDQAAVCNETDEDGPGHEAYESCTTTAFLRM